MPGIMKPPEGAHGASRAPISRQGYHAWLEHQPHGRFERIDGEVIEMPPELVEHTRVKAGIWLALRAALAAAGLADRYEVLPDGPTVQVGDGSDYEPDVVVTQGRAPAKAKYAVDPVIIVEVLSRGSKRVDTADKLADYFTIPTVRHYLIVSADRQKAVHHRRLDDGQIATLPIRGGAIVFDPPGLTITLEDCYQLV